MEMKSIAILQPVYLPWLGYFEQMAVCDEFMFLDDVQYTKNDWRNRNQIRTKEGWMWLTVPIKKARLDQTLQETEIDYQGRWISKQLGAIKMNYTATPYFHDIFPIIEVAIEKRPKRLIDLTIPLVLAIAEYLHLDTPITYASHIPKAKYPKNDALISHASHASSTDIDRLNRIVDRLNRIVELCHARSAQLLYTGQAAKAYMSEDYLQSKGINIIYQDYIHPKYKQKFNGFSSHMAIIDLLMNYGPKSREILLSSPFPKQLDLQYRTHG